MLLADFLGWTSDDWDATIGLAGVFFVFFPLLVNGIVVFIIAQVIGERAQNLAYARGETDAGSTP
jgi:phage shock protein PspC (stress-responsive transcriptional regulator)